MKIRTKRRILGPSSEWSEARARKLLEHKLLPDAQLRQDWTALIPGAGNGRSAGEAAGPLSVREAATDYVEALGRYEHPNTVSAYRSPVVKHRLPSLAYTDDERTVDRALAEVDEALMLRFVSTKQAERAVLQDTAETLAELDSDVCGDPELLKPQLDAEEWHLLCRYGQRGGRHMVLDPSASGLISLCSRGLSNNEINRCVARMRDIVRMANRRYKLGIDDPTQGCSLPRGDPSREWLHPVQMQALLNAAQTLDANPAQDAYPQHGRYSAVLALGLLGPRVSEFCAPIAPGANGGRNRTPASACVRAGAFAIRGVGSDMNLLGEVVVNRVRPRGALVMRCCGGATPADRVRDRLRRPASSALGQGRLLRGTATGRRSGAARVRPRG